MDSFLNPNQTTIEMRLKENPEMPLEEFLSETTVVTSFRNCSRIVENYVKKHEREILHESLKLEMSRTVLSAFLLLTSTNQSEIINEILEMNFFTDVCLTHFQSGVNSGIIGRMAGLAGNFLMTGFKKASTKFETIIFKFLDFLDNISVMNMYESLFAKTSMTYEPQWWLLEKGLVTEISKRINAIDISYNAPMYDDYFAKYANLYKLITIACESPVLLRGFSCDTLVASLTHSFRFAPPFVEGAKWGAINALFRKDALLYIDTFVPMAVSLLTNATKKATPDVVNCITFISKLMSVSADYRDLLVKTQIPSIVLRIMLQFQNSSILMNVFIEYTLNAVRYDEFCDKILHSYIPLFISMILSNERTPLTPLVMQLMLDLINYGKSNKKFKQKLNAVDCFQEVQRTILSKYKKKLDSSYGGEIYVNIAMTVE